MDNNGGVEMGGGGKGWGLDWGGGEGRELYLNNNKIREEKRKQRNFCWTRKKKQS